MGYAWAASAGGGTADDSRKADASAGATLTADRAVRLCVRVGASGGAAKRVWHACGQLWSVSAATAAYAGKPRAIERDLEEIGSVCSMARVMAKLAARKPPAWRRQR